MGDPLSPQLSAFTEGGPGTAIKPGLICRMWQHKGENHSAPSSQQVPEGKSRHGQCFHLNLAPLHPLIFEISWCLLCPSRIPVGPMQCPELPGSLVLMCRGHYRACFTWVLAGNEIEMEYASCTVAVSSTEVRQDYFVPFHFLAMIQVPLPLLLHCRGCQNDLFP